MMERDTNTTPDFTIRLVGEGLRPGRVPARTLNRILSAVQRLVDQRDDWGADDWITNERVDLDQGEDGQTDDQSRSSTLHLIGIKSTSAAYEIASMARERTLRLLHELGSGINAPADSGWRPSTISSVDDLSQVALQLRCTIEFREPSNDTSLGELIAEIRPDTAAQISQGAFTYGHTSVYGRLEGVGGATARRCRIHVRDRPHMLFCDVATTELVRELGKYIYADVILTGAAVWYRSNHQLKTLNVCSFDVAKKESFTEINRQIRDAGGDAWDNIPDPDAYLREMRS